MAKDYIKLVAAVCVFAWPCVGHGQPVTQRLAEIYNAELGVREAGRNDGPRIREYLAYAGFYSPAPWCAAFVAWCHGQAGVENPESAWSPSWFPNNKTIYKRGTSTNEQPAQGDVFGLYYPNLGRIAHVGFVDQWDYGSWVVTVEGNTNAGGGREGHGVYKKRRLKRSIYKVSRWIKN